MLKLPRQLVQISNKRFFSTICHFKNKSETLVEFKEIQKGQIWLIDNLLSEEECKSYIELAESQGFEDAPVTVGANSFKMMKDYRNNKRVILDDDKLAQQIYSKVEEYIPEFASELNVNSRKINTEFFQKCGVNERFRFYRYTSDEYFKAHFDGNFARDNVARTLENGKTNLYEESSFITMLIYLNTVEKGGETNFINVGGPNRILHSVSPKTGRVLLFVHRLLHEGVPVGDPYQFKYALRTDVMYRRPMGLFSSLHW